MRIMPVNGTRTASRCLRGAAVPLAVVLSAAVMLTGCATTKAATVIDAPPLAVPQAPERVLVPAEQDPLVATAVGLDAPVASVPRVQPTMPPRGTRPVRNEADARGEAAQPATSTAAQTSSGVSDANRQLRVIPSPTDATADHQSVQNLINKVNADLRKVDPTKLGANDSKNYRDSKSLSEQAQEKLNERNVTIASVAAQKAADLAATLPNR